MTIYKERIRNVNGLSDTLWKKNSSKYIVHKIYFSQDIPVQQFLYFPNENYSDSHDKLNIIPIR